MTLALDDIEYWRLTVADRLVLVQDILDSVLAEAQATPLPAEQLTEMNRRMDEIESGAVTCLPWEEVRGRFLGGS